MNLSNQIDAFHFLLRHANLAHLRFLLHFHFSYLSFVGLVHSPAFLIFHTIVYDFQSLISHAIVYIVDDIALHFIYILLVKF